MFKNGLTNDTTQTYLISTQRFKVKFAEQDLEASNRDDRFYKLYVSW